MKPFFLKNLIFLSSFLLIGITEAKAQKVYSVNYESQADVKVFVVKYESQADLTQVAGFPSKTKIFLLF